MKRTIITAVLAILLAFSSNGWASSTFDHYYLRLNGVLMACVVGGTVNYAILKQDPVELNTFLVDAAQITRTEYDLWSKEKRLAFLLNVYNATTLKFVLNHYPISSIKQVAIATTTGLVGPTTDNPLVPTPEVPDPLVPDPLLAIMVLNAPTEQPFVWNTDSLDLFGGRITLDHLENEILRKEFKEPRIHFALCKAAKGSPPLRSEAFTSDRLDEQLRDQTRQFLNLSPDQNRYDQSSNTLFLSPIFYWYAEDFKAAAISILNYVRLYKPEVSRDAVIQYTHYDWSLNQ